VANLVKQILSKQDLNAVADAIARAEKQTSGEIRVAVRQRRHRRERAMSVEELARREFHHLGMTKTKYHNGVLLFVLLEHRELFVLADEQIHGKVEAQTWQRVAESTATRFSRKEYRDGLIEAVTELGGILAKHFPPERGDTDELPNEVDVR
jgi:uncharacterized membrane protein